MLFNKFQEYVESYFYKYPLIIRKNIEHIFCAQEIKKNKSSIIMGQFIVNRPRKPYIVIYYGSFNKVYKDKDEEFVKKTIEEVIDHEMNHLLEFMNGTNKTAHEELVKRSPGIDYKELFLFILFCIVLIAVFYNLMQL